MGLKARIQNRISKFKPVIEKAKKFHSHIIKHKDIYNKGINKALDYRFPANTHKIDVSNPKQAAKEINGLVFGNKAVKKNTPAQMNTNKY